MNTVHKPVRVPPPRQRGITMLVVLVLLAVMMLGGLSLARMTEVGTLVAGNVSYKERAVQAAEVGVNEAYAAVQAMTDLQEAADQGGWYHAERLKTTSEGLPDGVVWDNTREVLVGAHDEFSVRYVVERMCSGVAAAGSVEQACLLKKEPLLASGRGGSEAFDVPLGKQYRVTVRVTGPKNARTFVQTLVTRG